jgi:hypothetical protein
MKERLKVKTVKILFFEFGFSKDVWGFCLFNKLCYTNHFGFEII